MSSRIHVATRKGLFTLDWRSPEDWTLNGPEFLGVPVSIMLCDPRNGTLYAALDHGHFGCHLHRSRDGGATWDEIAVPKFPEGATVPQFMPDQPEQGEAADPDAPPPTKPAALSEIWSLEPGGPDEPGVLWCGTIPGALFKSDDEGDSWQLVEALWNLPERYKWFGGGKDDSGLHSICVDPRDARHVTVAISCGGVWQTHDGGDSWRATCEGMRAEYMPPEQAGDPSAQDPHRLAVCPADPETMWVQHHNGVFRSTNGGEQWDELTEVPPSVFGFAVVIHPHDANTAWLVPAKKDEFRVPIDAQMVVTKTTDGGESFTVHRTGLPQEHAYDIVFRHALDVDSTGERLAMGSSTGGLWLSDNAGESWHTVAPHLPPIYAVRFAADV